MAKSVSQIEYDVTNYRNVLDQLLTLRGRSESLYNALRYQLAHPEYITSTVQRSGWAMKNRGGKSERRWTQIAGPAIGLGNLRIGFWPSNSTSPMLHHRDRSKINSFRNKVEPNFHVTSRTLQGRVYDILSLIRSLNMEMNRLRIQMPYDLRQLAAQMDRHASEFTRNEGTTSRTRGRTGKRITNTIPNAISMFQVFEEIKKLHKDWLPKMQHRIRKRIEEAKLQKKVAEETIRAENLATQKRKEKEEAERKRRQKEIAARKKEIEAEKKAAEKAEKEHWAHIAPQKAEKEHWAHIAPQKAEKEHWAHIAPQKAALQKAALQKAKQENEAEITNMAKEQGDSPGTGNGAAVAGILALLAIAGAG